MQHPLNVASQRYTGRFMCRFTHFMSLPNRFNVASAPLQVASVPLRVAFAMLNCQGLTAAFAMLNCRFSTAFLPLYHRFSSLLGTSTSLYVSYHRTAWPGLALERSHT
eukprot:7065360-Prymnesium_polylepis.1